MPTDESNLARVLKALLSAGNVTLEETQVSSLGNVQKAWFLSVDSAIILDHQHALSVMQCDLGGNAQ